MSSSREPYDHFRRPPAGPAPARRRTTDRGVYADRIARLLDGFSKKAGPASEEVAPLAPLPDLVAALRRIYDFASAGGTPQAAAAATLLGRLLEVSERLGSAERSSEATPEEEELRLGFNELFEFMLNPDSKRGGARVQ